MKLPRRPVLLILLALLTVMVQQGALLHGLSHGLESRHSELRNDGGVAASSVCEACVAYTAVGAALPSAAQLPSLAYDPPTPAALRAWTATTTRLACRARAPPPSV